MTRTLRDQGALTKDRRSRSGLSQQSELQRKNGAGAHNWGSFKQEGDHENAANQDAARETEANVDDDDEAGEGIDTLPEPPKGQDLQNVRPVNTATTAGAANKDFATSPSESMSSLDSMPRRRMSNVTDEERESARVYREGGVKQNGIDLAHIARTSYGIAQSPPNSSSGYIATSPTKLKGAFMK